MRMGSAEFFTGVMLPWLSLRRGTLRGNQYHNTVRKMGKYRNTVLKIDELPIPYLWLVMLT